MSHSCFRVNHIGTFTCNGWIIIVHHKITPHACRQVD